MEVGAIVNHSGAITRGSGGIPSILVQLKAILVQ